MYTRWNFPNKKNDEHIIMFLHRHWIVPLKILFINFLLFLIPIIFYIAISNYSSFLELEAYYALFVLLTSAFYLFIILFAFTNFVDYYLDVWIVTNMRIINIEQKGLFSRIISEQELSVVQDITSDVSGLFATMLDYGNVYVQTAGEKEYFIFKQIPFAADIARKLNNIVAEYKKMHQTIEPEL